MATRRIIEWAVLAVIVLGIWGHGYFKGAGHVEAKWEAERVARKAAEVEEAARVASVQERVVYKTIDRWRVVERAGATITRTVKEYVKEDPDCSVSRGFVSVHDAAAANVPVPHAPGPADAEPSGIGPTAVAETVAGNYQRFHEVKAQCEGLMEFVRGVASH